MLFDVSLYHIELISIFEFNTFRNYAEVLLYTTVKIHTALTSASLSSGGLSRERQTKIVYGDSFPADLCFHQIAMQDTRGKSCTFFSFVNLLNHLFKPPELLRASRLLWQEWHTQLWALWKSTFCHLRLFLILSWFLLQVFHRNQQTCPLWITSPLTAYWLQLCLLIKGMLVPLIIN